MIDTRLLEQGKVAPHASYSRTGAHLSAKRLFISLLTIGALLGTGSLACSAELFPYTPPSTTQQRPMVQRPSLAPSLSAEERERLADLSAQAKKLSVPEQQQLKEVLRKSLASAGKAKNLAQVQYYSEALRQLE
ncbi:MAG TPA: hypothetical protein DDY39_15895 [Nitrospira sp.]|nr:hypothetical protein [Nitrospira sp.]HBR50402.1 hypothetical protein [Nitrospira sp.]